MKPIALCSLVAATAVAPTLKAQTKVYSDWRFDPGFTVEALAKSTPDLMGNYPWLVTGNNNERGYTDDFSQSVNDPLRGWSDYATGLAVVQDSQGNKGETYCVDWTGFVQSSVAGEWAVPGQSIYTFDMTVVDHDDDIATWRDRDLVFATYDADGHFKLAIRHLSNGYQLVNQDDVQGLFDLGQDPYILGLDDHMTKNKAGNYEVWFGNWQYFGILETDPTLTNWSVKQYWDPDINSINGIVSEKQQNGDIRIVLGSDSGLAQYTIPKPGRHLGNSNMNASIAPRAIFGQLKKEWQIDPGYSVQFITDTPLTQMGNYPVLISGGYNDEQGYTPDFSEHVEDPLNGYSWDDVGGAAARRYGDDKVLHPLYTVSDDGVARNTWAMDYIVHNVTRIYDMSAIDISDDQDMNNLSTKIQVYAMENTTEGWVLQMESFGYMDRWYTEKQAEIPGMEKMPGEHIITLDDHINRGQSGMEMWFATDGGHMGILQSTWSLHNWFVKEVYKPDQNTQIDALMTMPGPDGQTFVYTGGDGTIAKYVLTPHN